MSYKEGWTAREYERWSAAFAAFGAIAAFGWLATDFWVLGVAAIVFLVMSFWADIEKDRN